jgi:hypothetical protein
MKVGEEVRSGGVSHYVLEPTGSDLAEPTSGFRSFVDSLHYGTVSTAVALGQFQRQLQHALLAAASHTQQSANASDR